METYQKGKCCLIVLMSLLGVGLFSSSAMAQEMKPKQTSITIYNQNLGIVHQVYRMDIARGASKINITDVPGNLIPSSVNLDLNGEVLEQNFENNSFNTSEAIKKFFLKKHIRLISKTGNVIDGILEAINGSRAIIKRQQGDFILVPDLWSYNIAMDKLPAGFVKQSSLNWLVESRKKGLQDVSLTYQTHGLNWQANYVSVLNDQETKMKLNAWANLSNHTGQNYRDVSVKLIAGTLNLNQPRPVFERMALQAKPKNNSASDHLSQRSFADYHMYSLNRKVDLSGNSNKEVRLFEEKTVNVTKKYVLEDHFYGSAGHREKANITVQLSLHNTKENNLGLPLPVGQINIYKKENNNLILLGQDHIKPTPENAEITLNLGQAFDIQAEEVVKSYRKISDRMNEQDYVLTINNQKNEAFDVEVKRLINQNSQIKNASLPYKKVSATEYLFKVPVPKKGKATLKYTIQNRY